MALTRAVSVPRLARRLEEVAARPRNRVVDKHVHTPLAAQHLRAELTYRALVAEVEPVRPSVPAGDGRLLGRALAGRDVACRDDDGRPSRRESVGDVPPVEAGTAGDNGNRAR